MDPTDRLRNSSQSESMRSDSSIGSQQSSDLESGEKNTEVLACSSQLWIPSILRPAVLIAFAIIFSAIALCLGLVAWFASKHQGICRTDSDYQYLWTYAPTACFTIIAGLWSQVDYRFRLLMPWILMARGAQPAQRSVLLDYVSQGVHVAFPRSAKSRDFLLTAALLGTILLKLLVVLSAGLFTLKSVPITLSPNAISGGRSFSDLPLNASEVNYQPAARVYGIESLNMSFPFGTNGSLAAQVPPFINGSNQAIGNIAEVDTFSADIDCEEAQVRSFEKLVYPQRTVMVYTVPKPIQRRGYPPESSTEDGSIFSGRGVGEFTKNMFNFTADLTTDSCPRVSTRGESILPWPTVLDTNSTFECIDDNFRFVLGVFAIHNVTIFSSNATGTVQQMMDYSYGGESFLVCKPRHWFQKSEMTYNRISTTKESQWRLGDLENARPRNLSSLSIKSLVQAFGNTMSSPNKGSDLNITLLLNMTLPQKETKEFLNATILSEAVEKLYKMTTVQLANIHLLQDSSGSLNVSEIVIQSRLQLRGYALWITEAVLVILGLTSALLARSFKSGVVSRDPGSISGIATILARSRSLKETLSGKSLSDKKRLEEALETYKFSTKATSVGSNSASFRILADCTKDSAHNREDKGETDSKVPKYHPFVMSRKAGFAIIIFAVGMFAALESIHQVQVSQKHKGFTTVSDRDYIEYVWKYIPIILLLLLGQTFAGLDFEVKTIEPFRRLRTGPSPAKSTLSENYFAYVSPRILYSSMKKAQHRIFASTLAVALSPLLTIAASGLYTSASVTEVRSVQANVNGFAIDVLNRNTGDLQTNGLASANLVLNDNMGLPEGTYDSFVVPQLQNINAHPDVSESSTVEFTVPALQAMANCEPMKPWSAEFYWTATGYEIMVHHNLTACGANIKEQFPRIKVAYKEGFFAYWVDRSDLLHACPENFAIVGHVNASKEVDEITMLRCKPRLDQLDARINLSYPGLHTDRSSIHGPLLDDTTRKPLTNITFPGISDNFLTPYISTEELSSFGSVDGFFGTIVKNGVPISDLIGKQNVKRLLSEIDTLYSRIMAQVLNINRNESLQTTDTGSETTPLSVSGSLHIADRIRLIQTPVSTRILEALLLIMTACAIGVYWVAADSTAAKGILPQNPHCIAAIAGLLADSRIVQERQESGEEEAATVRAPPLIPPGSEWCSDEELERRGIFEGILFSLGYWRDSRSEANEGVEAKRWFGINIGEASWE